MKLNKHDLMEAMNSNLLEFLSKSRKKELVVVAVILKQIAEDKEIRKEYGKSQDGIYKAFNENGWYIIRQCHETKNGFTLFQKELEQYGLGLKEIKELSINDLAGCVIFSDDKNKQFIPMLQEFRIDNSGKAVIFGVKLNPTFREMLAKIDNQILADLVGDDLFAHPKNGLGLSVSALKLYLLIEAYQGQDFVLLNTQDLADVLGIDSDLFMIVKEICEEVSQKTQYDVVCYALSNEMIFRIKTK